MFSIIGVGNGALWSAESVKEGNKTCVFDEDNIGKKHWFSRNITCLEIWIRLVWGSKQRNPFWLTLYPRKAHLMDWAVSLFLRGGGKCIKHTHPKVCRLSYVGWQWWSLKYGESRFNFCEGSLLIKYVAVVRASTQNFGGTKVSISRVLTTSKRCRLIAFCYSILLWSIRTWSLRNNALDLQERLEIMRYIFSARIWS